MSHYPGQKKETFNLLGLQLMPNVQDRQEIGGDICLTLEKKETSDF